ncbi:zinc finger protein ZFAT-like [Hyalella azteca]|uniref:Zinc finger protein ZFAT-like n=1 Tax=Hyalella azteca TaxID=294128 RepID=A0A8B7P8K4_HYAAZ|nr:zinc finger protein ZFAT-like [Hyalella azteca]
MNIEIILQIKLILELTLQTYFFLDYCLLCLLSYEIFLSLIRTSIKNNHIIMAYNIKAYKVLHQVPNAAVIRDSCAEQSLSDVCVGACSIKSEESCGSSSLPKISAIYIKEEPEDEEVAQSVKPEVLCTAEHERSPPRLPCPPCKLEAQVEVRGAHQDSKQNIGAASDRQVDTSCQDLVNAGQEEQKAAGKLNSSEGMSVSEESGGHVAANNLHVAINDFSKRAVHDFKCKSCDYVIDSKKSLKMHRFFKHGEGNLFSCNLCNHVASTKWNLSAHMLYKHSTENRLKCELCSYATAIKANFKIHQSSKHGLGKQLPCEKCDYVAADNKIMKQHMFSKHGLGTGFYCNLCDYATAKERTLRVHIFSKHGKGTSLKCNLCDYETAAEWNLKRHLFSKHNVGHGFHCKLCDYETALEWNLKRHLFSKHGIGNGLKCRLCDHVDIHWHGLKAHCIAVHGIGKRLQCELCDHSTANRTHLNVHMLTKHGLGKGLKCKLCDYVAATKYRFNKHQEAKHSLSAANQMNCL